MPIQGPNGFQDRLKKEFDEATTDRTINGLGSGVAEEDTDSDNDPKAARSKAHAHGHKKEAGGAKGMLAGLSDSTGPISAFSGQKTAHASGTGADVDEHSDAADSDGLHGEVEDLATPSDAQSAAPARSGTQPQPRRIVGADAGSATSPATSSSAPVALASDGTKGATGSASAADTTPASAAASDTPDTADTSDTSNSASAAGTSDSAATDATSAAEAALANLGVTASDPTVQAAEVQLYGDLQATTPNASTIKTDTDNLVAAMKAAGQSDQTAQVLQKMTLDPSASVMGSAMALVEAAKNGINIDDSSKDKAAAAMTQKQIDRKKAIAQQKAAAAAALAQQEAAQNAAQQTQQSYVKKHHQESSDGSSSTGGGGGGGSTGGTGGTSGGGGSSSSGSINAPAGAEAGVTGAGHGTPIPWNEFKQMNYGSPTHINNEEETYTTDGSNFKVNADGSATIKATWNGNGYNSARIEGPKVGSLPAYISAVVQNPSAQGTWPAFWLCGPNWPVGGEVDMMEQVNGGKLVQSTHSGTQTGVDANHTSTSINGIDLNNKSNEVGALITSTGVKFYVNGKLTKTVNMTSVDPDWAKHASNMSIITNLAMGGSWPGHAPNTGDQSMQIKGVYRSNTAPDGSSS